MLSSYESREKHSANPNSYGYISISNKTGSIVDGPSNINFNASSLFKLVL
jgi:hypothetical protein